MNLDAPSSAVPKGLRELGRFPDEEEVPTGQLLGWISTAVGGPLLEELVALVNTAAEQEDERFHALLSLEATVREASEQLLVAAEAFEEIYPPVPINEGEPF